MWTYQNVCIAHVRSVDDVLSDKYYLLWLKSDETHEIGGIIKGNPGIANLKKKTLSISFMAG